MSDLVDATGVPQGTAYDYIQQLDATGLVARTRDQRPYEHDADPISLEISAGGET